MSKPTRVLVVERGRYPDRLDVEAFAKGFGWSRTAYVTEPACKEFFQLLGCKSPSEWRAYERQLDETRQLLGKVQMPSKWRRRFF